MEHHLPLNCLQTSYTGGKKKFYLKLLLFDEGVVGGDERVLLATSLLINYPTVCKVGDNGAHRRESICYYM